MIYHSFMLRGGSAKFFRTPAQSEYYRYETVCYMNIMVRMRMCKCRYSHAMARSEA
jgi:hypothetical protein